MGRSQGVVIRMRMGRGRRTSKRMTLRRHRCFGRFSLEIFSGSISGRDLAGRPWVAVWSWRHRWLSRRAARATGATSSHSASREGLRSAASRDEVPSTSNVPLVGWATTVRSRRLRVRSICHQPLGCWGVGPSGSWCWFQFVLGDSVLVFDGSFVFWC
jgi:hypothetical protein